MLSKTSVKNFLTYKAFFLIDIKYKNKGFSVAPLLSSMIIGLLSGGALFHRPYRMHAL